MGDNAACANNCAFADGHAAKNGSIAANRCPMFDSSWYTGPIGFCLERPGLVSRPRVTIVDKHDSMSNKTVVLDRHALADKSVARDFDVFAEPGAFLNFDKSTNPALVADLTPVQVHESIYLDIAAQFHVGCDAHKIRSYHR